MYLAIDIGGTKTLLAAFDEQGAIIKVVRFETPSAYSDFLHSLHENAREFQDISFNSGAIGVRGVIDRNHGLLVHDSVLQWSNAPLTKDTTELFDCPMVIENDSKCAGLAEAIATDEYQKKSIVYITISTGIGSALIVDGHLNQQMINSEVGKWIFEHKGNLQTWEQFASGSAIVGQFGMQAREISDPAIWKQVCDNLALGIINICAAYTPDQIILGGGVGSHFDKFESYLHQSLDEIYELTDDAVTIPVITGAKHPEEAVIYGCYELAKQAKV